MTPLNDDELRACFDELQADDRASMPSFRAQWARAEAAAIVPRRRVLAPVLVAAAAVVMLTASIVVRQFADADHTRRMAPLSITNWKSPTAGLLRMSGREFLAPPSILSSTLDGVLRASVNNKGASR